MSLGKNLRRILDDRKMSVAQLAREADIPVKTVYHWLAGQQPRKIEHLFRICEILNLTMEELYDRPKTKSDLPTIPQLNETFHAGIYEVILRPIKKEPEGTV